MILIWLKVVCVLIFVARNCHADSGSIKICVIGARGNTNDSISIHDKIDAIALFIAKNHTKAAQIYEHETGDVCEFIGRIDRAKMQADFILVARRHNDTKLECDVEWGRESFAIMKLYPDGHQSNATNDDVNFNAKLSFTSSEGNETNWLSVTSGSSLMTTLTPRFMSPQSRIPEDYPFKAEREQRVKQRTMKAICALMALAVISLLLILFMGSLSRYNEAKKKRIEEEQRIKKKMEAANAPPPATKKPLDSERSVREKEKSEKSEKKNDSVRKDKEKEH
uniref:DOMON domain-containing protein n=1 Tax=Caenorhabditis japonica TaxID=281687 RepID=A0A8R1I7U6_CAEJA